MQLLKDIERRDPAELLGDGNLPAGIAFESQREFLRKTLAEVPQRKDGTQFVQEDDEAVGSLTYRNHMNSQGSPSQAVSRNYQWTPGTELNRDPAGSRQPAVA